MELQTKTLHEKTPIKEVYLGADPEFLILDKFKILDASLHNFKVTNFGSIGHDGHKWIAELRPNYSNDPLQIIQNMRAIMISKINHDPKFANYDFLAGSYYQEKSLGGHIHFSSNSPDIKQMARVTNGYLNWTYILDNYVTLCTILLENVDEGKKRRHSGDYGFYGDWRPQSWGFEHRTCSSWISSPHIAAAILCLSKVVMHEILNNPNFPFRVKDCYDDFHYMKVDKLRSRFPEIWCDIQKMSLYGKYKPYIDLIYNFVSKRKNWCSSNKKLKESWGIINHKEEMPVNYPRFKSISMDSIWGSSLGEKRPERKGKGWNDYGKYKSLFDGSDYTGD